MPGPRASLENFGLYTEPMSTNQITECSDQGDVCAWGYSMVAIVNMPVDNGRMYMVLGQTWPSLLVTYTVQG